MASDFTKVLEALHGRREKAVAAAIQAINEFGEHVLGQAQQLAPVGGGTHSPRDPAPGTLAASATAEPAELIGSKIEKQIGFGGAAGAYAAVQHENEEFGHDQGQFHYLKDAFDGNEDKFAPFVAGRIKAAVES
jgi:hypothetical protein